MKKNWESAGKGSREEEKGENIKIEEWKEDNEMNEGRKEGRIKESGIIWRRERKKNGMNEMKKNRKPGERERKKNGRKRRW